VGVIEVESFVDVCTECNTKLWNYNNVCFINLLPRYTLLNDVGLSDPQRHITIVICELFCVL